MEIILLIMFGIVAGFCYYEQKTIDEMKEELEKLKKGK